LIPKYQKLSIWMKKCISECNAHLVSFQCIIAEDYPVHDFMIIIEFCSIIDLLEI
jgi:hypothetical protein